MRAFLAFFVLFISAASWAQDKGEQLKSLAQGALIVVLDNRAAEGEKLWKAGMHKESQVLMEQAHVDNLEFHDLLQKNFTFCKLFFVFKSDLPDLRSGKTKGIFLNLDLTPDTAIELMNTRFCLLQKGVWSESFNWDGLVLTTLQNWGTSEVENSRKPTTTRSKYAVKKNETPVISQPNAILLTDFDGHLIALPFVPQVKATGKPDKMRWDKAISILNLTLHEAYKTL